MNHVVPSIPNFRTSCSEHGHRQLSRRSESEHTYTVVLTQRYKMQILLKIRSTGVHLVSLAFDIKDLSSAIMTIAQEKQQSAIHGVDDKNDSVLDPDHSSISPAAPWNHGLGPSSFCGSSGSFELANMEKERLSGGNAKRIRNNDNNRVVRSHYLVAEDCWEQIAAELST